MKPSLRSWLWRVPIDEEVDEELAFHLEMLTRELMGRGMDADRARATALGRLGDLARFKQTCIHLGKKREREMRLTRWLEELGADIVFALRQLKTSPAFTAVAVATLALGIGVNSAIFALVDATLLRPLPFQQPERLVTIWERTDVSPRSRVSPPNLIDWRDRSRAFEDIAAFTPGVGGMVMAGADGTAETVSRQWVTASVFDVLGIRPVAGRTFQRADEEQRLSAVVISEPFWRARFGGDPTVIGRELKLDGAPFTVVGVVPGTFQLFGQTSIWGLFQIDRRQELRSLYMLQTVGRLKPGITIAAARADLTAISDDLGREFPDSNSGRSVTLEPMRDSIIGRDVRFTSILFVAVVGFVLLICCANVANLLLARATVRGRELAIRSALGAGRRRIARQLLTESVVLASIGAALGMVTGAVILKIAPALIPQGLLPPAVTLSFDARVVAFCVGAALFVGLLFGIAPVWQVTRGSQTLAIGSESRTSTGTGARLRSVLVAAEVATAVLLLVGAGLLLRTLLAVQGVDRGYRATEGLTMMVDPLGSSYPTAATLEQFYNEVGDEIRAIPGVANVAWTSTLPLGPGEIGRSWFDIPGDPPVPETRRPATEFQIVSASYFDTIELPLLAGRGFQPADTRDGVRVCIVNEAFVRNHLQGRSPLGVRVAFRPAGARQATPVVREIVGVVRQVKGRPDETEDLLQVYVPLSQEILDDIYLVVKPASGPAAALTPAVRAAIARVDREQLVSVRDMRTLDDIARAGTARHRFRAVLVISFAGLALMLAMVGLFGILAYSVQLRRRDIGVRRALGASNRDLLRLVGFNALRVVGSGAAIGLIAAMFLGRLLTAVLFGVQPTDGMTLAAVVALIGATASLAVAGPAIRALRIDPALALRHK